MVNMEWAKSIFEAWNDKLWNDCTGVKIWMSNPVWPCLTFGIYDYYLEPTGGYFGCKKACEPVHIQWNIRSGEVKVINNTLKPLDGVTAEARIYQMDGREYARQSAARELPGQHRHQVLRPGRRRTPRRPGRRTTCRRFISSSSNSRTATARCSRTTSTGRAGPAANTSNSTTCPRSSRRDGQPDAHQGRLQGHRRPPQR